MSTFGKNLIINLFGESHGEMIGIIINNLPAGITLDEDRINLELSKRRPKGKISTPRQEQDPYKIVSGYFNNKTTGSPLTIIIPNGDTISKDYNKSILRPSHADYTSYIKYKDFNDYRGSGHFSGRITTPLVILGAICSQILEQKGIIVSSHILSIKDQEESRFSYKTLQKEVLKTLNLSDFPLLEPEKESLFKDIILEASTNKDSVGGIVETAINGLNPGYGDPFFESIESVIAHLIFSVPAVKGIDFGAGFDITRMFGSQANDPFTVIDGKIQTKSNHSGGIQGGISNGMPIVFKTAIKPTASIGKPQETIDISTNKAVKLELIGRHDPCIVHRVIHVINAITSYAILELILRKEGLGWIN
jgi:chorismate synthase